MHKYFVDGVSNANAVEFTALPTVLAAPVGRLQDVLQGRYKPLLGSPASAGGHTSPKTTADSPSRTGESA